MTTTRLRLLADIPNWRPHSKVYGQNARLHPLARARMVKRARKLVGNALMVAGWPKELLAGRRRPGTHLVTFTVVQAGGGPLQDDDGLSGCLKSCRDAVAGWLGCDDSPRGPVRWRYRSCRGPIDRVVMTLDQVG